MLRLLHTKGHCRFIIFGFIIIGLSLVSMCINVIQLKLEELFEELLLAMMEEYGTQAEGMPGPGMKPKMGFVDLWKMWHKRRQRKAAAQNAQNGRCTSAFAVPQTRVAGTRRKAFSELNIWRIFPFAKRRREALLHEFHTRLQHVRRTKTNFQRQGICRRTRPRRPSSTTTSCFTRLATLVS